MCRLKTLILEGTANASVLTLGKFSTKFFSPGLTHSLIFLPSIHPRLASKIRASVAFTLERFLAICGSAKSIPPSTQTLFNTKSVSQIKRIACRNIALIWAISLCGAAPLVSLARINYLEYDNVPLEASGWCGLPYNEPDKRWELVMLSSTVIFFLIPLIIISFLYYQIARKLKKATKLDSSHQSDIHLTDHATSRKIIQSRKIVIRMLGKFRASLFTFPFRWQRKLFKM